MATVESIAGVGGRLIALEGNHEQISTQLHLLPASQKILVLPSILESLPQLQPNESFDPRSFVQHIHTLFTERTKKVHSFLELSTSTQPRLVFTNGGSISARAACIARIAESIPDNNIEIAEEIFNDIVKDGVAGLERYDSADVGEENTADQLRPGTRENAQPEDLDEDPTIKAMKAAEDLDLEAASLVSDESVDNSAEALHGNRTIIEVEDTAGNGARNESFEVTGKDNTTDDLLKIRQKRRSRIPVREMIFTAPKGEEIRRTVVLLPTQASLWARRCASTSHIPQISSLPSKSYCGDVARDFWSEDEYDDDFDDSSMADDTFPSTPVVVFGEACLVDVQSTESETPLRRVKSMDRLSPGHLKKRDITPNRRSLQHSRSHHQLQSKIVNHESNNDIRGYFQTLPRTTFVRASQTTIRRSPTMSEDASSCASSIRAPTRVFIDRGTDADDIVPVFQGFESPNTSRTADSVPFQPVFPLVEDLIINLTTRGSNELFDSVLASYKSGSYPIIPSTNSVDGHTTEIVVSEEDMSDSLRPTSNMTEETDDFGYMNHNANPSHRHRTDKTTQWPLPDDLVRVDSKMPLQPPTPCMTPPPNSLAQKFVEFFPGTTINAVTLQNSLRQILGVHFPSSAGYTQHIFPAPPEMERLWKPVLRIDDSGSIGEDGRTADQILALGCETGVKKEFFAQISGHIERLGSKKTGLNRSGKLDLRYLISNIMQSPTVQPDLLTNPALLATLLIPQLEAYLASNVSTKFLVLHYTPEHLGTVLALSKLLGSDIVKIAGILDTLSSDPPSFSRPRTPQLNPLSNEATLARPSSRRHQNLTLKQQLTNTTDVQSAKPKKSDADLSSRASSPPSFSKANYLIPNTATDAEITTFLSAIWKSLVEKSAFYTPDPEPKPVLSSMSMTPPTPTPRVSTPKTPTGPHTASSAAAFRELRDRERAAYAQEVSYPPSSFKPPKSSQSTMPDKVSRLTGQDRPTYSKSYAPSVASSVRTTASERVRREDRAWENFYIAEEDSEDDAYDKMILGRGYARIVPEVRKVGAAAGKRPTKKALKWLGLA